MEVTTLNGSAPVADGGHKGVKKAESGFSALLASVDGAAKAAAGRASVGTAASSLKAHPRGMAEQLLAHAADKDGRATGGESLGQTGVGLHNASEKAKPSLGREGAGLTVPVEGAADDIKVSVHARVSTKDAAGKRGSVEDRREASTKDVAAADLVTVESAESPRSGRGLDAHSSIGEQAAESKAGKAEKADRKGSHKDAPKIDEVNGRNGEMPLQAGAAQVFAHIPVAEATQLPGSTREVSSARKGAAVGDTGATTAAAFKKPEIKQGVGEDAPTAALFAKHLDLAADKAQPAVQSSAASSYEVTVPVGQQGWSEAIGKTMVNMLKDGVTQAVVSINPENLGPVDIKISMENGVVDVDFFSPYPEVRDALVSGADQLQARFAEAGVRLERVESHDTLPVMKEDSGQDQEGRREQASGQQEQRREPRRENSWLADVLDDEASI